MNELLCRRNQEAGAFIATVVMPAFEELQAALARYGREVLLRDGGAEVSMRVRNDGQDEFEYTVKTRVTLERAVAYAEIATRAGWPRRTTESALRAEHGGESVTDLTKEDIIRQALTAYKAHVTP
jgi:hypothetical protein